MSAHANDFRVDMLGYVRYAPMPRAQRPEPITPAVMRRLDAPALRQAIKPGTGRLGTCLHCDARIEIGRRGPLRQVCTDCKRTQRRDYQRRYRAGRNDAA